MRPSKKETEAPTLVGTICEFAFAFALIGGALCSSAAIIALALLAPAPLVAFSVGGILGWWLAGSIEDEPKDTQGDK